MEGLIHVKTKEVKEALQKMKSGKAPGPSGVTHDLLKYAGETRLHKLMKIFQSIEAEGTVPEWGE